MFQLGDVCRSKRGISIGAACTERIPISMALCEGSCVLLYSTQVPLANSRRRRYCFEKFGSDCN